MYIEDLFLAIRARVGWPPGHDPFDGLLHGQWYMEFIRSVGQHIMAGKSLSTNQSKAILKLIGKVRRPLVRLGMATDDDIDQMLSQPEFRQPVYESANIPREVRYVGDNLLAFRFKQNDGIIDRIKALGHPEINLLMANIPNKLPRPHFHWDQRIWLVPVLRHNLDQILTLINEYQFQADAAVWTYLRRARESRDQPSVFAFAAEHATIFGNVCDDPLLAAWVINVAEGIVL